MFVLVQGIPLDGGMGNQPGNALPQPPQFPSNSLPGSGSPDNSLPGGGHPWLPGHGNPGAGTLPGSPGYPSQGLPPSPGRPDNSLPGGGSMNPLPTNEAWLLAFHPAYGYKWIPAGSLGSGGNRPDNSLPGGGGRPDNSLPGGGWSGRPDNTLPGEGEEEVDNELPPTASPKK
jgi:hypothetical protein